MLRVVTYVLALTMISSASWAQTNMTPVPSTFGRKAVAQVIDRLGQLRPSALASPTANNGIPYNGGPILDDANGVNVYFIWMETGATTGSPRRSWSISSRTSAGHPTSASIRRTTASTPPRVARRWCGTPS